MKTQELPTFKDTYIVIYFKLNYYYTSPGMGNPLYQQAIGSFESQNCGPLASGTEDFKYAHNEN